LAKAAGYNQRGMLKFLRRHWGVSVIIILSVITIWPLFLPGYFPHHDDLHIIRIFEMRRCFADLQIPCRWVPDMGYGNGYPLFNYYNPFVYYLGAVFSYVIGYIWAAKVLFVLALTLGPIGVYLLARKLWGSLPGVVAAVVFMFAPYRALDVYVRGALAELFAISLIPFILFFIMRLAEKRRKRDFLFLTILLGVFLTTHNISVVIWGPFIFLWSLYFIYKNKGSIKSLLLSALLGVGLSAFFTIPAFIERNLVSTITLVQADLNFQIHFTAVRQLFLDRFWGYGASGQGLDDMLSLQIGWPHWWLVIMAALLLLLPILEGLSSKGKDVKWQKHVLPLGLITLFFVSIFMTHNKSTPIWDSIGILSFVQFPWRFLGIAVFAASLLGGYAISMYKQKLGVIISIFIMVVSVIFNWSYFRPENFLTNIDDRAKLTGDLWEAQRKGAIFDYLPVTAIEPKEPADGEPKLISGKADIFGFVKRSNYWEFEVKEGSDAWEVEVPVFQFPGWVVKNYDWSSGESGRIIIEGGGSDQKIMGMLRNTGIRSFGNIITLVSIASLFIIWRYEKDRVFTG